MVKISTELGPKPMTITVEQSEVTKAYRWVAKSSNGRLLFYSPWNNSKVLLKRTLENLIVKIKSDLIRIEDNETTLGL